MSVQFRPCPSAASSDVAAAIASMMSTASPNFRYQCPQADLLELAAGQTPSKIRIFVEYTDVRSGPQPDTEFITSYDTSLFRDVIVSEVRGQLPAPTESGVLFTDYVILATDGKTIFPFGQNESEVG